MKDTAITLRISVEEKETLKAAAEIRDISLSQLIRELIREALKDNK